MINTDQKNLCHHEHSILASGEDNKYIFKEYTVYQMVLNAMEKKA